MIYQRERFPLAVHIPLIGAFSFSAIAYSRLCRGVTGFIPVADYAACMLTNLVLFFLLRVSDEHKDRADDAQYRPYLPVPRGLVTLGELRHVALVLFAVVTCVNMICYPRLLLLYGIMMGYLLLMRYEFFMPQALRQRQLLYNISHMAIIPLADMYASGYDWQLGHATPPAGLLFFLGVSYLNGFVLETGRKIRTAEKEETGVISYTRLWGRKGAPLIWIALLAANFTLACIAARYAGHTQATYYVLTALFAGCIIPAALFIVKPSEKAYKGIELMSLLWALGMYLVLGGIPLAAALWTQS